MSEQPARNVQTMTIREAVNALVSTMQPPEGRAFIEKPKVYIDMEQGVVVIDAVTMYKPAPAAPAPAPEAPAPLAPAPRSRLNGDLLKTPS